MRTFVSGQNRIAPLPVQIRSLDEARRTITFVASTEAEDRYGDVIRVNGWKFDNYKKNGVFLWGHRSSDPPIGKCVGIRTESSPPALVQDIEFATKEVYPFADTIFKLYKGGFLKAVSVGFLPLEEPKVRKDEDGGRIGEEFTSQELLELSAVSVPANPEALSRAVTKGIVTDEDARRFEVFMKGLCGEDNPSWAYLAPGVTYTPEQEQEQSVEVPEAKQSELENEALGETRVRPSEQLKTFCDEGKRLADSFQRKLDSAEEKIDKVLMILEPLSDVDGDAEPDDGPDSEPDNDEPDGNGNPPVEDAEPPKQMENTCPAGDACPNFKKLLEKDDSGSSDSGGDGGDSSGGDVSSASFSGKTGKTKHGPEKSTFKNIVALSAEVSALRDSVTLLADEVRAALNARIESRQKAHEKAQEKVQSTVLAEEKTVCPYHEEKKAPKDEPWDASVEMAKQSTPEGWKRMCTVIVGDASLKGSHKLPHHKGDGFATVYRGVTNALARLEQTDMPSGDRAGARSHLTKHKAEFEDKNFDAVAFETSLEAMGRVYRHIVKLGDEGSATFMDGIIQNFVRGEHAELKTVPNPFEEFFGQLTVKPEEKGDRQNKAGTGDDLQQLLDSLVVSN